MTVLMAVSLTRAGMQTWLTAVSDSVLAASKEQQQAIRRLKQLKAEVVQAKKPGRQISASNAVGSLEWVGESSSRILLFHIFTQAARMHLVLKITVCWIPKAAQQAKTAEVVATGRLEHSTVHRS